MATKDTAYFLRLFNAILPEEYIQELQQRPDGGYEILRACAAVGERVSTAIDHVDTENITVGALPGSTASVQVTFTTSTPTAYTLQAGTLVGNSQGLLLSTLANAAFSGPGQLVIPASAVAVGYEYNLAGETVTAAGETIPGDISEVWRIVTATPTFDETLRVTNVSAANGGTADTLALAGERYGVQRTSVTEPTEHFRWRIQNRRLAITPDAINETIQELAAFWGVSATLIEPRDPRLSGIFVTADATGNSSAVGFVGDTRPGRVILSSRTSRRYFAVEIGLVTVPECILELYRELAARKMAGVQFDILPFGVLP
jgi:hypothetical protein